MNRLEMGEIEWSSGDTLPGALDDEPPFTPVQLNCVGDAKAIFESRRPRIYVGIVGRAHVFEASELRSKM